MTTNEQQPQSNSPDMILWEDFLDDTPWNNPPTADDYDFLSEGEIVDQSMLSPFDYTDTSAFNPMYYADSTLMEGFEPYQESQQPEDITDIDLNYDPTSSTTFTPVVDSTQKEITISDFDKTADSDSQVVGFSSEGWSRDIESSSEQVDGNMAGASSRFQEYDVDKEAVTEDQLSLNPSLSDYDSSSSTSTQHGRYENAHKGREPRQLSLFSEEELACTYPTPCVITRGMSSDFAQTKSYSQVTTPKSVSSSEFNTPSSSNSSSYLNKGRSNSSDAAPKTVVQDKVESQYSRTFNTEYNYEAQGEQLITEVVPGVTHTDEVRWLDTDRKPYATPMPVYRQYKPAYMRLPLTDFHRMLCRDDFYDVDEYLELAERPVITIEENIHNKQKLPPYSGYEYPGEPITFIGKLTDIQYDTKRPNDKWWYCFTAMDLNKYKLPAFKRDNGRFMPSYQQFDLTDAKIGSWYWCKGVNATKSNSIAWAAVKELNPPCLKDIYKNPDPKFRPQGWQILNKKVIFDSTLLEGKHIKELEGFPLRVYDGKTKIYYGSLNGMLG